MLKISSYLLLLLLYASNLFSQNIFQKHFGNFSGADYIRKIIPTNDGGFATTGYSTSSGKGGQDVCLTKFNSYGDIQWSKTYGGEGDDEGISLIETSDGGYLLIGHTRSNSFGVNDIYVIKTTSNGEMVWNKTYGGSQRDLAWDVMELEGQKYLLLCQTQSFSHGLLDVCLMTIDANGGIEWAKSYGGIQNDWCYNMRKTRDGEYLLAGVTSSYGSGLHDMLLMKVNKDGIIRFCITIGGSWEDYAYCSNQDGDGHYLVGGKTSSVNGDLENVLIKLDNTLTPLWQKYFGATGDEVLMNILPTEANGYYVSGWSYCYGAGERDVFLANFSKLGNLNWLKSYGGSEHDVISQKSSFIIGNRIVLGANTKSYTILTLRSPEWNGYLIKTDMSGNSGCHEKSYSPSALNPNLSFNNITSIVGIMPASFNTSFVGNDLAAALQVVSLCFTGIDDSDKSEFMRIENPFSTELLINIPVNCFTYVNLIVRDVIGRKVYEHQLNIPDRFQIRIETSSWGNGVYLVELHSDHGTLYSKVLKQ